MTIVLSKKIIKDVSKYVVSKRDRVVVQSYLDECILKQVPHNLPTIPVYVLFGAKYVQEITCIMDAFALSIATRVVYLTFKNFNTVIEKVSVEFDHKTQRGDIKRIQAKFDQLETIHYSRDNYFANVMTKSVYPDRDEEDSQEDLYGEHCANCNTFEINSNIKYFPNLLYVNLADNHYIYNDTTPSIYEESESDSDSEDESEIKKNNAYGVKSGLLFFNGLYGKGYSNRDENEYIYSEIVDATIVDVHPQFGKSLKFVKKLAIAMPTFMYNNVNAWLTENFFEHMTKLKVINIGSMGRRTDPIDLKDISITPIVFPKISHLNNLTELGLYGFYLTDLSFLKDCNELSVYVSDVDADNLNSEIVPNTVSVSGNRHDPDWQINDDYN